MKEIIINATPHLIWAGVVIAIIFFFPSLTAEFVSRIQRISISKEGVELERAVEKAQEASRKRDDNTSPKQLQLALRRIPLNRKILWVDDNPVQNELEIEALQDAGLQIVTVTSNSQAASALTGTQFDLIISDIGRDPPQPKSSGLTLPIEIAENRNNVPPIIYYVGAVTGKRTPDGYPVTSLPSELIRWVGDVLLLNDR